MSVKNWLFALRLGVTDLVSSNRGEVYNNFGLFEQRTEMVMMKLLDQLPLWLEYIENKK